MATLKKKVQVEHMTRRMLEEGGLPQPDAVEYGYGSVRFFYKEQKLCFIVDIDDPEDDDYGAGSAEIEEVSDAELN